MTEPAIEFADSGSEVIRAAQEAARGLRHNYVGTEHLLIGVLMTDGGAARALTESDLTEARVRSQVVRIIGAGEEAVSEAADIPITPLAQRIIERGAREAVGRNSEVRAEHILFALVQENEGVAARILLDFDVNGAQIERRLMPLLNEPSAEESPSAPPSSEVSTSSDQSSAEADIGEVTEEEIEPPEAIPTHADRPATADALGRSRLAEVLGERIRRVRGENTEFAVTSRRLRRKKHRLERKDARDAGSFMVHIHAPWGAGKSSLLNFLAADLRNRSANTRQNQLGQAIDFFFGRRRPTNPRLSRWIVVEFSAWEHQRLVPPWWWLLAAIQRSCGRELWRIDRRRWALFWLRDLAWRLWNIRAAMFTVLIVAAILLVASARDWFGADLSSLNAVQALVLAATSSIALIGTLVGLARAAGRWLAIGSAEGAVRFLRRAHDPLGVYRRRFRWLIRSSDRPVTVFIDDLDRCRPSYVVELLEGIQTLFADEPVTYVIAADRNWLCQSFAQSYEEFEGSVGDLGRPLGLLFLEKTFQISIEIPPMGDTDRYRFWGKLLQGLEPSRSDTAPREDGSEGADFADLASQAEVEERIGKLLAEGADGDDVFSAAVRRLNAPQLQQQLENLLIEFAPLLENNPRSMKRLMNAYGIERDRLLREGCLLNRSERRVLALLTILRLRWPALADHLQRTPGDAEFCCAGEAPEDHPLREVILDDEVKKLFDGSLVDEQLSVADLAEFPRSG